MTKIRAAAQFILKRHTFGLPAGEAPNKACLDLAERDVRRILAVFSELGYGAYTIHELLDEPNFPNFDSFFPRAV